LKSSFLEKGAGGIPAVTLAITHLYSAHEEVRLFAVGAVVQLSKGGQDVAISALISALSDTSGKVRQLAVCALEGVAGKGHKAAIAGVAALLEHSSWSIRWSAARALARLAHRDDVATKKEISGYFCHPHQRVRDVAAFVVSNVFGTGIAARRRFLLETTIKLASGGESVADADLDGGELGRCEDQHGHVAGGCALDSSLRHKPRVYTSRAERRRKSRAFHPLKVAALPSRAPPEAIVAAMAYKAERSRQAWRRWVRCFGRAQSAATHSAASSPSRCKRPLSAILSPDAKSSCNKQRAI